MDGTSDNRLFRVFEEINNYPTANFERFLILPDSKFPPKMIIGVQYLNGNVITIIKDVKKTIPEIINPRRVGPEEMTLFKPLGYNSFYRPEFSTFGRWVYTTSLGTTLNYVEYDIAQPENKKTISKLITLNNDIIGVSPNFDCILTFVYDDLNPKFSIYNIDSNAGTISDPIDVTKLILEDFYIGPIRLAVGQRDFIQIGDNGWAFRMA